MDVDRLIDDSAATLQRLRPAALLLLRRLEQIDVIDRLRRRDAGLWHPAPTTQAAIRARLGWLEAPSPADVRAAHTLARACLSPGVRDVLVVATGGAGAQARLWRWLAGPQRAPRLHVLESLEPARVRARLARLDPRATLVLLVLPEPPGVMVEALARIVANWLPAAGAARRLVALVAGDAARGLAAMLDAAPVALPADVGERWATLSRLGLVLAALAGVDLEALTGGARAMLEACFAPDLWRNPGARLGAWLGALAQAGYDLLELMPAPRTHALNSWLAVLLLGSLSKHRRGWVPITAGWPARRDQAHHLVVRAERTLATPSHAVPLLSYRYHDTATLGALLMLWHVGVAVAAITLGLNPFDQPDSDALEAALRQRLAGEMAPAPPSVLPLEPAALPAARWALLAAYGVAERQAAEVAVALRDRYALPICLVHPLATPAWATQVAHAGRGDAPVLVLAQPPAADLPVPGCAWSLAELGQQRLAIDLLAWQRAGRPVGQLTVRDAVA